MKKFFALATLLLILTSCNMPGSQTESPDLVATNVAMILTNAPTATPETQPGFPVITTSTPTTFAAQESLTPPIPTETLAASTATSPSAPLTTPSPSATLSPEDPAVRFGEPDKTDEFTDSAAVWDYEDDWYRQLVNDGELQLTSKGTPWWNSWYTVSPAVKNFYLETTVSLVNCQGADRFGLVFRLNNTSQFYFMGLTCGGEWGFSRYTADNQVVDLRDYQTSDAIHPVSESNRLGVLAQGNNFEFYINGVKVGTASDSAYPDAGTCGFLSMSAGTANFRTDVDKLEYWYLD